MLYIKNIDIIIPCYNSAKTLPSTLASIVTQSIKDQCNIYICDDCSTDNYTDILKTFSNMLNITYLRADVNGGAGQARQIGIDNSSSDYIIFIDSDDTFNGAFAVELLYQEFNKNKDAEVVVGNFEEQINNNGNIDLFMHSYNSIWLHGKMFKRSFLIKNNIKFNNTRLNEDVYFLGLVWATTEKIVHLNKSVYLWITNENSLTRNIKDDLARYKTIIGFVDNQVKLYQEKKKRSIDKTCISVQQSVDALIVCYFYCNEIFKQYDDEAGNHFLDMCRIFYNVVWSDVKGIATNEYLNDRYYSIITNMTSARVNIPIMTLYEFIKLIKDF